MWMEWIVRMKWGRLGISLVAVWNMRGIRG